MAITRSTVLRKTNVSAKVVEKFETHILCPITVFDNRVVYEIMWKKKVEHGRPYGTCALHAVYLRLQIHTQVV